MRAGLSLKKWFSAAKSHYKVLLILAGVLAVAALVYWQSHFFLSAYLNYETRRITVALPVCDRVEVFHLYGNAFFEVPEDGLTKVFPVGDGHAKFLADRTLIGVEAEALAALWRKKTFGRKYSHLCHSPACGLRFYRGKKVSLETSVCFHCSNFYFPAAILGPVLTGFDSEDSQAKELLERLKELFPASQPGGDPVPHET